MANNEIEHDPGGKDTSTNEDRFARGDAHKYSGRSSVVVIIAIVLIVAIVYVYYNWGR